MNDNINKNQEKWVTAKQLAEILQVSEITIRRWVKDNKIKFHKIGRTVRFKLSELDQDSLQKEENQ